MDRIVLVLDQPNMHAPASPCMVVSAVRARRLTEKLAIRSTLGYGRWLNTAGLDLGVLQRQCLRQRLVDRTAMERAVAAWTERRNTSAKRIDWQVTTTDVRTRLRRLDPACED
jgi:hypothetical protein